MTMLQTRPQITATFAEELGRFSNLVRSLDNEMMSRPSRCSGWTAGDVARHFIGTIADVAAGQLEGQGTPEVTARQVHDRRAATGADLADELDKAMAGFATLVGSLDDAAWAGPAGGDFDFSLGEGVEALLFDAVVHADDIAAAVGIDHRPTPGGVVACVSHVAYNLDVQNWGPARLELDGVPPVDIGQSGPTDAAPPSDVAAVAHEAAADPAAPARRIAGDPFAFVLAGTGRLDPAVIGLDPSVNIYR